MQDQEAEVVESEDDGEDIMDGMEKDYEANPTMDNYEGAGLDDGGNNRELDFD
jgi:hypothetical protein